MEVLKKMFAPKSPAQKKVFIVEDNPAYAKFLQNFLKTRFPEIAECRIFPVGETCLLSMPEHPDVVIIDYFLNSKYSDAETGAETIRQIREHNSRVCIILLSAQDSSEFLRITTRKYNCVFIKKDEHAFHKVETLLRNQRRSKYFISADLISSILTASARSVRNGLSKLQSKTLSFFD